MRIGINVPTELMKQVKEMFPSDNVSQFIRQALQNRIKEEQHIKERVRNDGLDEKIDQLAQESGFPPEPDWVGLAMDNAADWIKVVTVEDWGNFWDLVDELQQEGKSGDLYVDMWTSDYGLKGLMNHLIDYENLLLRSAATSVRVRLAFDARDRGRREYNRAWLGYMYEVRRLIEQRRKEQFERIRAEYAAAMHARTQPEPPEHLL